MKNGWVYIIRMKDGPEPERGLIKIGWAGNPYTRLAELQCGNPYELEIVALAKGSIKCENRVHRRLSAYKARGEWFAVGGAWQAAVELELTGREYEPDKIAKAILAACQQDETNKWFAKQTAGGQG